MRAHQRLSTALVSIFIFFLLLSLLLINLDELLVYLTAIAAIIAGANVALFIKDLPMSMRELKEWGVENPQRALLMGVATIIAGIFVIIFFLYAYIGPDLTPNSSRELNTLIFGILGGVVLFIPGFLLIQIYRKKKG